METVTYDYKKMKRAVQLLDTIPVCGISQARAIAEIADILDSGTLGEIVEKGEKKDAVHDKKVQ